MKIRINLYQKAAYSAAISAMFISAGAYAAQESSAHQSGEQASGQADQQSVEQSVKKGMDKMRGQGGQSEQSGMQMSSEQISQVQSKLNQEGYNVGTPDGVLGRKTSQAIAQYQRDHGQQATGKLDQSTLSSLGVGMAGEKGAGGEQGGTSQQGSTDQQPGTGQ